MNVVWIIVSLVVAGLWIISCFHCYWLGQRDEVRRQVKRVRGEV